MARIGRWLADDFRRIHKREFIYTKFVEGYSPSETGYVDPPSGRLIMLIGLHRLDEFKLDCLSAAGYDVIDRSDFQPCCSCQKAVRVSEDSLSWIPNYLYEHSVTCWWCAKQYKEFIRRHLAGYVNMYLVRRIFAIRIRDLDMTEYGYESLSATPIRVARDNNMKLLRMHDRFAREGPCTPLFKVRSCDALYDYVDVFVEKKHFDRASEIAGENCRNLMPGSAIKIVDAKGVTWVQEAA